MKQLVISTPSCVTQQMKPLSSEKTTHAKLVRKTLRSLSERFAYKVTTMKKACDVRTMKLDEFMGSLQTFELNLKRNKNEKSIAFQAEKQESSYEGNSSDDESLILLTKIFNKFLRRMNMKKISQIFGRTNNFQKNKRM